MKSFSGIINFKTVMVSFSSIKKVVRKWWNPFSALTTLTVVKKWWSLFFSIKNFKNRKAVVEFFLSFKSFKSCKKMTESFFSGHASLNFHMMCKFPLTNFFSQFPLNFFNYNSILISMKKGVDHISINTVRAILLHK